MTLPGLIAETGTSSERWFGLFGNQSFNLGSSQIISGWDILVCCCGKKNPFYIIFTVCVFKCTLVGCISLTFLDCARWNISVCCYGKVNNFSNQPPCHSKANKVSGWFQWKPSLAWISTLQTLKSKHVGWRFSLELDSDLQFSFLLFIVLMFQQYLQEARWQKSKTRW